MPEKVTREVIAARRYERSVAGWPVQVRHRGRWHRLLIWIAGVHFELIRGDDHSWFPTAWRPFNGGACVSWLGTTVWAGRWSR